MLKYLLITMGKIIYLSIIFFIISFFINNPEAGASGERRDFYVAQQSLGDGFYDVAIEKLRAFISDFPKSENINSARLLLGRSYYEKKNFHLALGEFEQVISASGPDKKDEACYWMGRIYLENNDLVVAQGFFKKITDDFPQSELKDYGYYYLAVIANMAGDYAKAEEKCEVVIEKYKQSELFEPAYLELAKSLYGLNRRDESDKTLVDYLKNFPESALADKFYFQLAENSFFSSAFGRAIEFYKKAVEVNPKGEKKEEALKKIGLSYFELKEYEKAISVFDELIKTSPAPLFPAEVIFVKARSFENLGQNEEAIALFEKVIELDQNKPDYGFADDGCFEIADIYYKNGDYEKAVTFYNAFNQKFPQSSLKEEILYNLGWTYLRLKKYEEAIAEFQKITQKEVSKDALLKIIALCRLGDTYLDKGEYEQAMAAYDEVLEKYFNSFYSDYAQYQLAVVLEKSGHSDEAVIALETLIGNFTKSKLLDQAHYLLALQYFRKADYKKSLEHYQAIAANFPNSRYRELSILGEGYCYYNLREFDRALEIFKGFEKTFSNSEYSERIKFEIAQTLFALGKEKEAVEKLVQISKSAQDAEIKDEATFRLAQYDFTRKAYDVAEAQFSLLVENAGSNYYKSLAYYWLAKISYLKGEKENSLKFFELASNLSGTDESKLKIDFEKADVLLELSDIEKALVIYNDIIEKYPQGNFALLSFKKRADIELSRGKFVVARQDYGSALTEVKSDFNAQVQFQIAKTYLDEGRFDEALSEFFNVVYLYSDFVFRKEKALLQIAEIFQTQGKIDEARKIYIELSKSDTEVSQLAKNRLETISKAH